MTREPMSSSLMCEYSSLHPHPHPSGGYAIVGCGDGNLIIVDIVQGRMLYGMGAHKVSLPSVGPYHPLQALCAPNTVIGHYRCRALSGPLMPPPLSRTPWLQGAVRTIDVCEDRMITSGDDGKTMTFNF